MNLFSELREGLGISLDALRANKLRSALATLGIVMGIVTVTLMGAAINGLNQAFIRNVSSLGADVFYVSRFKWFNNSYEDWLSMRRRPPITLAQAETLARRLTLAQAVAPEASIEAPVQFGTRSAGGVDIIGTTEAYLQTSGVDVADGRFLTAADGESAQPVCVIGSDVATNLFRDESPLGRRLRIAEHSFLVVGVLQKQGLMFGNSLDNRIIVPLQAFLREVWSQPDIDEILVKAADTAHLDEAREELRQVMRHVRHLRPEQPDDFSINQQEQIVAWFHAQTAVIALVGLCVTSLALLVGGIGIMNIMFVSVAERTREIGVRKAIGARRRTILLQFLMEAASICFGGGMIGLGIAWGVTRLVRHWLFPASLSPVIVLLALGVSVMTGVISGFLPAWRAARMDPVEALRSE
jgi:putative ABC transport system permease protein